MATAALILVTAVWGVTFVQVKDAVELYPIFAFLAVRYAIASAALASPAVCRLRGLGREGFVAGGVTGLYVLFTPLLALALFHTPIPRELWAAVGLALIGLALLSGVPQGRPPGISSCC